MSTLVFPSLPGLAWSVMRRPTFTTLTRLSDSARETTLRMATVCSYEFELKYEFLRHRDGNTDLQQIQSLFLAVRGDYDIFLFEDPNDNNIVEGQIGTGNGVNTVFVLARNTGPYFYEAIGYLNALTSVSVDGVVQSPASYAWAKPNVIVFNSPPAAGKVVTATFSYYHVCRFLDASQDYEQFMKQLTRLQSVKFKSVVW